ncbi:uncharacterized protein METZ01_LOCUS228351, partial [marine metagenome]
KLLGHRDRLVRVHLARILAERKECKDDEYEWISGLLADEDPFVRRAAADAAGRHPHPSSFSTLIKAWEDAEEKDTHLVHVTRIALRNHFAAGALPNNAWQNELWANELLDIALAARGPKSAESVASFLAESIGADDTSSDDPANKSEKPSIGNWWYMGPFKAENFDKAFETAFAPEQEKEIDLGKILGDTDLSWKTKPDWKDGLVHNELKGENTAHYLYREINSPVARNLKLSLGSNDAVSLFLNRKQILNKKVRRAVAPDQEKLELSLAKGKNRLLLKIVNGGDASGFYFNAGLGVEEDKLMRAVSFVSEHVGLDKLATVVSLLDEQAGKDIGYRIRLHRKVWQGTKGGEKPYSRELGKLAEKVVRSHVQAKASGSSEDALRLASDLGLRDLFKPVLEILLSPQASSGTRLVALDACKNLSEFKFAPVARKLVLDHKEPESLRLAALSWLGSRKSRGDAKVLRAVLSSSHERLQRSFAKGLASSKTGAETL